jgi:hypothetical protein
MSFSKRAVHTLEGNETAIGVTALARAAWMARFASASLIDMSFA